VKKKEKVEMGIVRKNNKVNKGNGEKMLRRDCRKINEVKCNMDSEGE
jgi:hypothetical protein